MAVDLLIKNAQVVCPRSVTPANVGVKDGKIVVVAGHDYVVEAAETIDAGGRYLIPGAIDVHVHFREPGLDYKEDWTTGSMAAATGGVTTAFDMPNVNPSTWDVETFEIKRRIAAEKSYVNFGLYAYLLDGMQEHIEPLIDCGVAGFKWDMAIEPWEELGDPKYHVPDNYGALKAFRIIGKHGYNVGVHAEDIQIAFRLVEELKAAGRRDYRAHYESRPDFVEISALERAMLLADITNTHLHVHHLSSRRGLELIKRRKFEGLSVTAEVGPAWFLFSVDDYERMGAVIKVVPCIKTKEDAQALWEGLKDGSIDCLATDHAPHSREEKFERDWHNARPGTVGVETSMALMLDKINKGELTIQRYVAFACESPALIYGLYPRKGTISVGSDADLVILDMDKKWTITNEEMYSKNRFTPYHGWEVQGMPSIVIVNGDVVARERQIVGKPGRAKMVNPKKAW